MITISLWTLSASSSVGPTHHPTERLHGCSAAATASCAAAMDFPVRTPATRTRRFAFERWTSICPRCGRYPSSRNRIALSRRIRVVLGLLELIPAIRLVVALEQRLDLALRDLLDRGRMAVGRLAEDQELLLPGDAERGRGHPQCLVGRQ